jgi:ribosomal protein L44E
MANRRLTAKELDELFYPLIAEVRDRLGKLCGNDPVLFWALRRKLAKELTYDERGKPMHRKALKVKKRLEQNDRCATCSCELPESNVVLDRLNAMDGYTAENTRLICRDCDYKIQTERKFA